ncbi:uncharacterized protein LOC129761032 [Uranotaenia lowii]|uniref:uncharacterized protein LOC129761032 n=1 Tax=Uranotaenia lowii TaxID=190385 RepID=UPI00247AD2B7|nr:uncharacterized protein LOC129761032 [Uranotaenia lowii]
MEEERGTEFTGEQCEQQIVQNVALFSPASYNMPQFRFLHLPSSAVRNSWVAWIRWFENVMVATGIKDGITRKAQLLAIGGAELQSVYYGITGDDSDVSDGTDPYQKAKQMLSDHFAPKQHESYERFEFWTLKKGDDEPIEKYLIRIKQQAEKCYFGKTEIESRQIAILDKLNQNAPEELRRKLLEKQHLSLDDATRIVNSFQAIKYQAARISQQSNTTQINRVDFNRTSLNKNKYKMEYKPVKCAMCGFAKHREADTTFYVIEGGQQPLLGKVTAQNLGLLRVGLPSCVNNQVNRVNTDKSFPKIKDFQLTLPIDDSIPAVIQPLRRCPIPMLQKVKEKLDELLSVGIIERVDKPSPWVSPLVPIIKDNGDLRLCVDMRKANKAIQRLNHPLPIFDNILPKLNGAKFFTTLDVKQAFHQVELAEESRYITTFITNWGLFRYTRLLFGINYAPEFFQSLMESILAECKNTVVFIDDIVVWGATETEHDDAVKTTLAALTNKGIALNVNKCRFKQREIDFLGHKLSGIGVAPADSKVKSILQCRPPQTKEELRSFLGLVTYVAKFIPDLAKVSHSIRQLLKNPI